MTTDASAVPVAGGHQFKCPNCAGAMSYDPASAALKCQYCGHAMAPPPAQPLGAASGNAVQQAAAGMKANASVREIPLSQGLAMAPKGLGTQVKAIQCRECGATVNVGPNEQTAACTYCASTMVLPVATDPNLITPESLVPFAVPKDRAGQLFKDWLARLWFRPSNLKHMAKLEQIVGVYVPYWTFDAHVHSEWTAERGWYYYETEEYTTVENGETVVRTREVRRVRWEPAWGSRHDVYDDVLVCASKGVPQDLADKLCTFNTQALVHYNPGYLAGWRAESYAIDLPDAWTQAQAKINQMQRSRCAGDVGGNTYQNLQVHNSFSHETFKHVLLPLYVAAYRYQGRPYRFLVNGQTGEVVGKAPYSFWKIAGLVLALLALIAVAIFISHYYQDSAAREVPAPSSTYARLLPSAFPLNAGPWHIMPRWA